MSDETDTSDEDDPFAKMDGEEVKRHDLAHQLDEMLKGSEFDKQLDKRIEEMEAQGLTEHQIMDQLMSGTNSGIDFDKESNFDPTKLKMDQDLMREFEKVMEQ